MELYELIRSRRKTLALEITTDCRVVVRAPMRASQKEIDAFVANHEAWINRHLASRQICADSAQGRRPGPEDPEAPGKYAWAGYARRSPPSPEEIRALKERGRALLPERVAYWSRRMGVAPTGLKITEAKGRYGSCSASDSLCFSCFLMRCPPEAIDLVVVHELCHIREKNHGPGFYRLLETYLPDWRERKKLLSMNRGPEDGEADPG